MERLDNRINSNPFRQPCEWEDKLNDAMAELADRACLKQSEKDHAKDFLVLLRFLVYAKLIVYFDVVMGDICCRFHFVYDEDGEDSDILDLSLLRFGCFDSVPVVLRAAVTDEAYARHLGLGRLESCPVGRMALQVVTPNAMTEVLEQPTDVPTGRGFGIPVGTDGNTQRFIILVGEGPENVAPDGPIEHTVDAPETSARTPGENSKQTCNKEDTDGDPK